MMAEVNSIFFIGRPRNPYKWLFDSSKLILNNCSMFVEDVV